MLVEVRSNKTVKYSNVHAVWSYLLGCQSTLAQEPCSSSLRGTVTCTHCTMTSSIAKQCQWDNESKRIPTYFPLHALSTCWCAQETKRRQWYDFRMNLPHNCVSSRMGRRNTASSINYHAFFRTQLFQHFRFLRLACWNLTNTLQTYNNISFTCSGI